MITPIYLTHTSVSFRAPFEDHGPTAAGRAVGFFALLLSYRLLRQKLENQLRLLVGLRQDRDTGLFQHLRLGQVRRFRGKVGILNGAARLSQVLCSGLQVTDRGREAILDGAELALETRDRLQGRVDRLDGRIGTGHGEHVVPGQRARGGNRLGGSVSNSGKIGAADLDVLTGRQGKLTLERGCCKGRRRRLSRRGGSRDYSSRRRIVGLNAGDATRIGAGTSAGRSREGLRKLNVAAVSRRQQNGARRGACRGRDAAILSGEAV